MDKSSLGLNQRGWSPYSGLVQARTLGVLGTRTPGQDQATLDRSVSDVQRAQQHAHADMGQTEKGQVDRRLHPSSTEELGVSDWCTLKEFCRNSNSESAKPLYRFQGLITGL